MFYVLSKILDILLTPLTWSVVLVAFALVGRGLSRRRRLAGVLGVALLLFFSLEGVGNALWRSLEMPPLRTVRERVTYDTVVLLGGVVDDRVQASSGQRAFNENNERLLETYDLLRKGAAKTAIVSGGAASPQRMQVVEARALADQLIAWGVDPERVLVEDQAKNTYENAVYSAKIIHDRGFHDVLILTSAFHMRRALGCFRAVGLEVDTLPVDFRSFDGRYSGELLPRARYLEMSTEAIREWFGRGIYRLRGYSR